MPGRGRSRPRRHYGSVEAAEEAAQFAYAEPPAGQGTKWAPLVKVFVAVAAVCAVSSVTVSSWRGGGTLSAQNLETNTAPGANDMTGFRAAQGGRSPAVSAEAGDASAPALPFTIHNKYTLRDGPLDSELGAFGDKVLMEPHRETFFAIASPVAGNLYRWTIGDEAVPQNEQGIASVTFMREQLWDTIPFKVEEIPVHGGGQPLRAAKGEVALRYVRRELRELFAEDREAFLSAMETVYGLSQEEGEARYGPRFTSSATLVGMHTDLAGARECDHLHRGFGFLPGHVAIGAAFEQALQVVDPSVALHYWDYAKDWETYQDIDTIYAKSEVTSMAFFGPFPTEGEPYELKDGRFGFVRMDMAPSGDVSNSYGILRSPWNNNPSAYVTRYTNRFMGNKQDEFDEYAATWPSCYDYFDYIEENKGDFASVVGNMEAIIHGKVHAVSGGVTELTDNYQGVNDLLQEYGQEDLYNLLFALPYMNPKDLWRTGLKECPMSCSLDTDPTDCKCYCNPYDADSAEDLDAFLVYIFSEHKTEDELAALPMEFKQKLVEYYCNDAYMAGDHMDSGSPADPSFWVVHGQMERYYMKISGLGLAGDSSDWPTGDDVYGGAKFPGTTECVGHADADVLPWTLVLGGVEGGYTNEEMVAALDPRAQQTPYVYASYGMAYCSATDYDVDALFEKLAGEALEARSPAVPGAVTAGPVYKELPQPVDLYIVNKGEGSIVRARVKKISSEVTTEAAVLVDGLVSPKDVYVDVSGEMIYWTDMETAQIARATLEGGERETIVSGTPKPALMAVDIAQRRLYWTDMDADAVGYAIRTADMDGGMEFVLMELEAQSKGIALTGGRLYWTEEDKGALLSNPGYTNQNGPVPEAKVLTGLDEPMYLEPHSDTDMFVYMGGTTESGAVVRYSLGEDGEVVEGDGRVVLTDVNKADALRFDATNGLLWVTLYYDGALVAVDLSAAEYAGVTPSMTEHRGVYCIDVVKGLDTPKGLAVLHVAAAEDALRGIEEEEEAGAMFGRMGG